MADNIELANATAANFRLDSLPVQLGGNEPYGGYIPDTAPCKGFHIDSDETADWYLKKKAALNAEEALIMAQAEAAVKRLQADRKSLENLYQSELEAYIAEKIANDKRGRKSVILPHGTCQFRRVPEGLKLADESAAAKAVLESDAYPGCCKVILDATAYRQLAEGRFENGELLPGMEVVPERESFSIRFGGKQDAE